MFSSLHTEIGGAVERLKAIAEANSVARQHSSAIGASRLQDWTQFAAPAVFGVAMRLDARTRLTESMPVHNLGPIFHGSGLDITVMSLNGALDVGLISCPELLPDLWEMADDFAVAREELLATAG